MLAEALEEEGLSIDQKAVTVDLYRPYAEALVIAVVGECDACRVQVWIVGVRIPEPGMGDHDPSCPSIRMCHHVAFTRQDVD